MRGQGLHTISYGKRVRMRSTLFRTRQNVTSEFLLSKDPEHELRQTCANADPSVNQLRGDNTPALGRSILARKICWTGGCPLSLCLTSWGLPCT
jgi:hypothetical protein